jgi:uncharacterized protein (TIGR02466 family)
MISETKFEKLFSSPLFRYDMANHEALSTALLAEGAAMRLEDDGVVKSNRRGWHSAGNLFDRKCDCITELRVAVELAVLHATRKMTSKVDPETFKMKLFGWMNVNPKDGYNAPHTHPGAHWSGVYYIAQPDTDDGSSGMIEFVAPRVDLPHWEILQTSAFRLKKRIRPTAGEIILFPSYLLHWVYPNEADADRITVAFNATFSK